MLLVRPQMFGPSSSMPSPSHNFFMLALTFMAGWFALEDLQG